MSRNDEVVTAWAIAESANLTWRQHQPGNEPWTTGRCRQCTDHGCEQLKWAVGVRSRTGSVTAAPVGPLAQG